MTILPQETIVKLVVLPVNAKAVGCTGNACRALAMIQSKPAKIGKCRADHAHVLTFFLLKVQMPYFLHQGWRWMPVACNEDDAQRPMMLPMSAEKNTESRK